MPPPRPTLRTARAGGLRASSVGASDGAAWLVAAAVRAACVPASVDLACARRRALLFQKAMIEAGSRAAPTAAGASAAGSRAEDLTASSARSPTRTAVWFEAALRRRRRPHRAVGSVAAAHGRRRKSAAAATRDQGGRGRRRRRRSSRGWLRWRRRGPRRPCSRPAPSARRRRRRRRAGRRRARRRRPDGGDDGGGGRNSWADGGGRFSGARSPCGAVAPPASLPSAPSSSRSVDELAMVDEAACRPRMAPAARRPELAPRRQLRASPSSAAPALRARAYEAQDGGCRAAAPPPRRRRTRSRGGGTWRATPGRLPLPGPTGGLPRRRGRRARTATRWCACDGGGLGGSLRQQTKLELSRQLRGRQRCRPGEEVALALSNCTMSSASRCAAPLAARVVRRGGQRLLVQLGAGALDVCARRAGPRSLTASRTGRRAASSILAEGCDGGEGLAPPATGGGGTSRRPTAGVKPCTRRHNHIIRPARRDLVLEAARRRRRRGARGRFGAAEFSAFGPLDIRTSFGGCPRAASCDERPYEGRRL